MRTLILVGVSLILALVGCQDNQNIPSSGVTKELAMKRSENISKLEYNIWFDIPEDQTKKIKGQVTVSFHRKNNESDLILDFRADKEQLSNVTVNNKKINYHFKNDHIVIPNQYLKEAENKVDISFIAGDQSLNRNEEYLYTLFVPDRASTAFPCFDQPDLKARYQLSLQIPQNWTAVTNGALFKKDTTNLKKKLDYKKTEPISTYLFAFVCGDFDTITRHENSRKITLYHREKDSVKLNNNIDRIFELQFNSITWLDEYTEIPYPFQKFDLILIPSFQYSGMEHPGAVYYRDSKLLLDKTATIRNKLGRANLIAHETAHMWFGDLVTMKWFNEVWLKEVFANFIADKITQPQFPDINHKLNFLLNHYPSSYSVDRTAGANPIQQQLGNLKNAGTLYGSIIYHKAPIVMQKLENQTGEASLQKGLQKYLADNQFNTATWDDLIAILDEYTRSNLEQWSHVWVNEPGMPHIKTKYVKNDKISLSQSDPYSQDRIWPQDLKLQIKNGKAYNQKESLNLKEINIEEVTVKRNQYKYIIPNADAQGYGYFVLDKQSKNFFLKNLSSLENDLERAITWINLWENLLNNNIEPTEFHKAILTHLPHEKNPQSIDLITSYLVTNYWKFLKKAQRKNVIEKTEKMIWQELQKDRSPEIKSSYFNAYMKLTDSEESLKNLYRLWKNEVQFKNLSLSTKDYTNLAFEIMLRDEENYTLIKEKQQENIKDAERKKRFLFIAEALSPKQKVRDTFFEQLLQAENREKEPWVITSLQYLHHPLRANSSRKYIQKSLKILPEIQATGDIFFPKSWIDATLSGHSSEKAKKTVADFLKNNPEFPKNLKRKVLQSSDMLNRAVKIKYPK